MADDRPSVVIAWIECETCGRIDKGVRDLTYPADIPVDTELSAPIRCERCGGQAKLYIRQEVKPAPH